MEQQPERCDSEVAAEDFTKIQSLLSSDVF